MDGHYLVEICSFVNSPGVLYRFVNYDAINKQAPPRRTLRSGTTEIKSASKMILYIGCKQRIRLAETALMW
jgi:hypothetical protein